MAATLMDGKGGVTAPNDKALIAGDLVLDRTGFDAPDATGTPMNRVKFKSLDTPVCSNPRVYFKRPICAPNSI